MRDRWWFLIFVVCTAAEAVVYSLASTRYAIAALVLLAAIVAALLIADRRGYFVKPS